MTDPSTTRQATEFLRAANAARWQALRLRIEADDQAAEASRLEREAVALIAGRGPSTASATDLAG